MRAWRERRPRRTRSTRWPSPAGGRSSISSPAGERPVNDLVDALGLAQPQVSKHLRVLREVGVVDVRDEGRRRLYRLNAAALKPIHDWVKRYERTWDERFDALDAVLDELKRQGGTAMTTTSSGTAAVTLPTDTRDPDHPRVRRARRTSSTGRGPHRSWSGAGGAASAASDDRARSTCASAARGAT